MRPRACMDRQPAVVEVNFTTPLQVKVKKSLSSVMTMMTMSPTVTKKQPREEAPAQMIPEETTPRFV